MSLSPIHLAYLKERGVKPERLADRYFSKGDDLCILYCDANGQPYKDSRGDDYIVKRLFPTGKPKFKAPIGSGSRVYFSPLMPEGYLEDINIPLVLIEGPVKVDACYQAIPTGFCFVGLTGTWNTKDRRDEKGNWDPDNDTRLLPELKAIPMRGRKVIILFDSDIEDNISVDDAATDIGNWTRKRGAKPHRCTLPSEPNGAKNGADDFLVRHGTVALQEHLDAAEIEGWPLPAPLLDSKGELKRSYSPSEEQRLFSLCADLQDHRMIDALCRKLCRRLGMTRNEMVNRIEDVRDGVSERGLFGDISELDAPDIDSRWIFPGILLKGEVIILSGLSGTGKTLLAYSMASAARRGASFLGMAAPKLRVCVLQLEEGGSFGRRMKAFGFAKEECGVGKSWNFIRSFNPLKPSHMEMLKTQVLPHYDLFILDSIREMSSGSGLNEALAEFSQQLIRPLVKVFRGTDKAMAVIDHNAKGTDQIAGGDDKRAAVWGVFNMRKASEHSENNITISSHQAHGGKSRDSDAIHWELKWEKLEDPKDGEDAYQWSLVSDLRPDCIDLNLLTRTLALLESYPAPLTLRQIGDRLGLSPDGSKVNAPLRQLAAKSSALRRYRIETSNPATYFMPEEHRHPAIAASYVSQLVKEVSKKPSSDTKGSNGFQRVPPVLPPSDGKGSEGFPQASASLQEGSPGTPPKPSQNPIIPVSNREVSSTPLGISRNPNLQPPALNGHTDAFWQIVKDSPGLLPIQIANKFQHATKRTISGAQAKALIAQGPPVPQFDDDEVI